MRILHLTDLHITEPNTNLDAQWFAIEEHIPHTLDFVVVSGDLTQKADPVEYRALERFLVDRVLKRVRDESRARVIVIPGNHDVDWTTAIEESSPPTETVEDYLGDPGKSVIHGTRLRADGNSAKLLTINRSMYNRRFDRCQDFMEKFYGKILANPHRMFALNDTNDGEHWSAHIFRDEGVAFVGLSSCAWNDKYWRGGGLSEDAIVAAGDYLRLNAPGCLRVAVWHHGLVSARGVPDHIALRELGKILQQGFQLGIHGHTHEDEINTLLPLFGDRSIPIIATGSFGAGAPERPRGVGNQMSLIDLTHAFVRWKVFEGDERGGPWKGRRSITLAIRATTSAPMPIESSLADNLERTAIVDERGLTRITVILRNVELNEDICLAAPDRAWGTIVADENATAKSQGLLEHLPVSRVESAGHVTFVLSTKAPVTYQSVEWNYTLTNVLALDGDEVEMLPGASRSIVLAPGEHDVWVYRVRICSRHLLLRLGLPKGHLKSACRALAQYQRPDGTWHDDPDEVSLSVVRQSADSIEISVPHPRPAYRYGVVYSLAKARPHLEARENVFVQTVVSDCRDSPAEYDGVSSALTKHVGFAIKKVLGGDAPKLWVGHLWSSDLRALAAAFGRFPTRSWGTLFRYGEGVAGHALRIRGPAVYCASSGNASSRALYLDSRSSVGGSLTDHRWLVSVPLLLKPGGACIGVLGFAHYDGQSESELLEAFAKEVTAHVRPDEAARFDEISSTFTRLSHGASFAFWGALAARAATDKRFRLAEEVLRSCWA